MNTFKKIWAAASIAALAGIAQAQNVLMTFEDISSLSQAPATYGVQFSHTSDDDFRLDAATFLPSYDGHFLGYYALNDRAETLTLSAGPAATFALHSLDLAGLVGFVPTDNFSIQISGLRANGTTVTASQSFGVLPGQFSTYGGAVFNDFTGLSSLTLSGIGAPYARYVGVDNIAITITPVPEPETVALFMAGLGILGWQARRRKAA